jgi:hypothetical protein
METKGVSYMPNLKKHLKELKMAERAIARAVELYAWTGHEELYQEASKLLAKAHVAEEVVETAIAAGG